MIGPALVVAVLLLVLLCPSDQVTRQSFWALRDRWILVSAWLAAALLLLHDWPLGCAGASVLVRWHAHEATPPKQPHQLLESLTVWIAILGWYLLVQALPPAVLAWCPTLFTACLGVHSLAVVGDWHWRAGHRAYFTRGLTGQRGLTGAMLALLTPFAWALHPAWALLALPGLVLTDSWLAWLALGAAWAVYWPRSLWLTVPVVLGAAGALSRASWRNRLDRTPRGTSLDGPLQRVWSVGLLLAVWVKEGYWRVGRGPDASLNDLVGLMYRYFPHRPARIISGHVHNEYVEWAYEGGLLAVLAMLGIGWRVGQHLVAGDPWSAAAVAGAVLAGGTLLTKSASTGLVWLTILAVVAR